MPFWVISFFLIFQDSQCVCCFFVGTTTSCGMPTPCSYPFNWLYNSSGPFSTTLGIIEKVKVKHSLSNIWVGSVKWASYWNNEIYWKVKSLQRWIYVTPHKIKQTFWKQTSLYFRRCSTCWINIYFDLSQTCISSCFYALLIWIITSQHSKFWAY